MTLSYPDYSKEFKMYINGSKTQLGAVITQSNRPIELISWRLTEAQQKYSVTEIKLLAIVETLKEFKGLLWYTDHENLTRDAQEFTSDRVY